MSSDLEFACSHCGADAGAGDQYCHTCGIVLSEAIVCPSHPSRNAIGVCVMCATPFCKSCGGEKLGVYLCDAHWGYETSEGMARVFGSIDNVQVQYVASCLEQRGFHPFIYSRHANPGPGMAGTQPLLAIRNYGRYPIAEIKVLVPFAEVIRAEEVVKEVEPAS